MRVALATAAHLPHGSEDDQVLITRMRAAGLAPTPVIWDADTDWTAFDAVIVRSVWDYHLKYARFLEWVDALDRAPLAVHNNPAVLRWNSDKRYMLELEQRGVRITRSRVVTRDDHISLEDILNSTGWRNVVIKPTVSSTGYETWFARAPCTSQDEQRFATQKTSMHVLVQEFAEGVRAGELSFVFLSHSYSHCVLKRAAGAEFRVHVEHGGSVQLHRPPAAQIEWAQRVMQAVPHPWTYARVDAVPEGDGLVLMELELLDPELFFKHEPAAAGRLISALA